MVTDLMMSSKIATLGYLKKSCFEIKFITSCFLYMTSATKFYHVAIRLILEKCLA